MITYAKPKKSQKSPVFHFNLYDSRILYGYKAEKHFFSLKEVLDYLLQKKQDHRAISELEKDLQERTVRIAMNFEDKELTISSEKIKALLRQRKENSDNV